MHMGIPANAYVTCMCMHMWFMQAFLKYLNGIQCIEKMLSAERLMRYTYINKENLLAPSGEKRPPDWPQKGEIELSNVSFLYSTNAPLVLKSLNCHIHPGEKVL